MNVTAFIYDLTNWKKKEKTYLMRKIFGYKDNSNHGKYKYERMGSLSPFIIDKWGKSVILIKKKNTKKVKKILNIEQIPFKVRKIKLLD